MFISLSKTLEKFGGVRLGIGLRMTKKNTIWMSLIIMFVSLCKAAWALMIISFWMVYAVCYGILYIIRKIYKSIKKEGNQA